MTQDFASEVREQGDVCLFKIDSIPSTAIAQEKEYVLALGEHTGHAHRLVDENENPDEMSRVHGAPEKKSPPKNFTVFKDPTSNVIYLRVHKETDLVHNEHTPVRIPIGDHRIGIVREKGMFDDMISPVLD